MQQAKGLSRIIEALYLVFFISLACSFRAVSSITIALLLLTGFIKNWLETKTFFTRDLKNPFLYGCLLLFLFYFISLLVNDNSKEGWSDLETKSGLVLMALALCYTSFINDATRKKLSFYFILVVTITSLYCLSAGIWHYFHSGDISSFFYHELVQPVKGHAIYFSVLVFIALLFLIEGRSEDRFISNKFLYLFLIIFLSIFLLLLSSKLVIGFYLLYLIFFFIARVKNRSVNRYVFTGLLVLFITTAIFVLTTNNPISRRFSDIMNGDLKVANKEKFNQGMYFNGVQFRLLQWKFTGKILNEHHAWLTGVGPGNAQQFLDQKYISSDMYIGEPARGDHGFLGYNTHNQFLETLLKTGVFGLAALLFTCFTLISIAWQQKKRETSFIIALLLSWLFTEAVLERQYGIMIFAFFPLFIYPAKK